VLRARILVADEIACHPTGIPALAAQEGYSRWERVSVRPTFEILRLPGGSTGEGQETVIPARAPPIQALAYDFGWVFGTRSL
jgi:hypothetical protein